MILQRRARDTTRLWKGEALCVSICQTNVENKLRNSLYLFPRLYGGHVVGVSLPLIVAVLKDFFHDSYKMRATTYGPSQSQQDSNLILHITSGSLEADQRPPLLYRHWQVGELVKASCNIAHDRGNPTKNRTRIQASKIKTSNSKFIRNKKN